MIIKNANYCMKSSINHGTSFKYILEILLFVKRLLFNIGAAIPLPEHTSDFYSQIQVYRLILKCGLWLTILSSIWLDLRKDVEVTHILSSTVYKERNRLVVN